MKKLLFAALVLTGCAASPMAPRPPVVEQITCDVKWYAYGKLNTGQWAQLFYTVYTMPCADTTAWRQQNGGAKK